MGLVPCQIIINCGFGKAAAARLAGWAEKDKSLRAIALELRDQEDELCRFGETLAILYGLDEQPFTEERRDAIYAGGTDAIAYRDKVDEFCEDDEQGVPTPKRRHTRDEIYAATKELLAAQKEFFVELVEYHEEAAT